MRRNTRSAASLTLLKKSTTQYPTRPEEARLEAFPNPKPTRSYTIHFDCPEFTCLCPITGQPDFGHLQIEYIPGPLCLESKSLKLYLFSFRNHGAFHEAVVNRILDDLVRILHPRWMKITGAFNRRGGIAITVTAEHPARKKGS
mgnify:CR=1 FL=1